MARFCASIVVCIALLAVLARGMPTSSFGLTGTYYNNTATAGDSALVRVDPSIDFVFSTAPIDGSDGSFFSVLWTGRMVVAMPGKYNFSVSTNGAIRLWVLDHLLIDDGNNAGSDRIIQGTVSVPMDPLHPAEIRVECVFYALSANAPAIKVSWANATGAAEGDNTLPHILTDGAVLLPDSSDAEVQRRKLYSSLVSGWGTHVNDNMLAFALLPQGFALGLGLYDTATGDYLSKTIVNRKGSDLFVHPGPHTRTPFYAEITRVSWRGFDALIQASEDANGDLSVLVTPLSNSTDASTVVVVASPSMTFGRAGDITVDSSGNMLARLPGFKSISVVSGGTALAGNYIKGVALPYAVFVAATPISFCIQTDASLPVVTASCNASTLASKLAQSRMVTLNGFASYGNLSDAYAAMRTVISWNSVYVPQEGSIVTPVSRGWDYSNAGYVLYDWDTYFCAMMAAVDDRDVAYANLIQVTKTKTVYGFVPNEKGGTVASWDRTEPIVGSMALLAIYNKFNDDWVVDLLFDDLFDWNTWMWQKRRAAEGYIQLGSDPNVPGSAPDIDTLQAARYESGLDNSPMYDDSDAQYNTSTHRMMLGDVGMTSLFLTDCECLREIASRTGRRAQMAALAVRFDGVLGSMKKGMWSQKEGLYMNVKTDAADEGRFATRLSPTHFYPLLAGAMTYSQAEDAIASHMRNPDEFCLGKCDYGLPSIARNDPAFPDNSYWRGRTWAPMNFLVYLGLRRYPDSHAASDAIDDLTESGLRLLLGEWADGHVHENYNTITGEGCDVESSDPFYHWGALHAYIALCEAGYMDPLPLGGSASGASTVALGAERSLS
eukprot:Opistho-2@27869